MGTRADFYVGKHETAEWIGSIAYDGYRDGIPDNILQATNEQEYRSAVYEFITSKDHGTLPEQGWPWPWDSSAISDKSYWFFEDRVWDHAYPREYVAGKKFYVPVVESMSIEGFYDEDGEITDPRFQDDVAEYIRFPDMSDKRNVAAPGSSRSGIMAIYLPE